MLISGFKLAGAAGWGWTELFGWLLQPQAQPSHL